MLVEVELIIFEKRLWFPVPALCVLIHGMHGAVLFMLSLGVDTPPPAT